MKKKERIEAVCRYSVSFLRKSMEGMAERKEPQRQERKWLGEEEIQ